MNITPTTTVCGNCGVEEQRLLLLHHVRHRGIFRRLCTSCVLKLHPQSFCPTCFLVYDGSPSPSSNEVVSCFKCDSFSHFHCVGGAKSTNPYTCPPCENPTTPVFDANCRELDKKAAKVLLAAVRVAAASMSKAAMGARAEAEKRAKEAAFARKRAREALEHVAFLVSREKMKRKESCLSAEVSYAKERNHKAGFGMYVLGRWCCDDIGGSSFANRDSLSNNDIEIPQRMLGIAYWFHARRQGYPLC